MVNSLVSFDGLSYWFCAHVSNVTTVASSLDSARLAFTVAVYFGVSVSYSKHLVANTMAESE